MRRRAIVNEGAFDKDLSADAAYFLGLLYTDGCLAHRLGEKNGNISLCSTDRDILVSYNEFLSGGNLRLNEVQVKKDDKNYGKMGYYIRFYNSIIYNRLLELGLFPRKSFINEYKFPLEVGDYGRDYVRGLFDGDGCFTFGYYGKLRDGSRYLMGNLHFFGQEVYCVALRRYMDSKGFRVSPVRRFKRSTFCFRLWTADVEKFYRWLYDGAKYYMERKRRKIKQFLQVRGNYV